MTLVQLVLLHLQTMGYAEGAVCGCHRSMLSTDQLKQQSTRNNVWLCFCASAAATVLSKSHFAYIRLGHPCALSLSTAAKQRSGN